MKKLIVLIFPLLVLSGCMELIDWGHTLPDISTSGKNTFGCRIMGDVFIPHRERDFVDFGPKVFYAYFGYGTIEISAFNDDFNGRGQWVEIFIGIDENGQLTGKGRINHDGLSAPLNIENWDQKPIRILPVNDNSFKVLRFDVVDNVGTEYSTLFFAATFRATVRKSSGSNKEITSGRFDVQIDFKKV
jgi:hypothetical protein